MAPLELSDVWRYSPGAVNAHYDPEVDVALIVLEAGSAVSDEQEWGLIDRDPTDGHLMGFEIWEASNRLPADLIAALPAPAPANDAA
jgi:uncharacterized protein YuzE